MPAAHRWAAALVCSKSLSRALPESNKRCSCCVCPSAKFSPGSADCTQSGWKGRSARTACKSEDRTRISDTAPESRSNSPAELRTRRTVRPCGFPAYSAGAAQKYYPGEPPPASPSSASAARCPNPGIRAAGICDRTNTPPETASFCAFAASCTSTSFPPPTATRAGTIHRSSTAGRPSGGAGEDELSFTYPGANIRTDRKLIGGNYGGS